MKRALLVAGVLFTGRAIQVLSQWCSELTNRVERLERQP